VAEHGKTCEKAPHKGDYCDPAGKHLTREELKKILRQHSIAELEQRCSNYENEIGESCPEDYSVKETVDALRKRVAELEQELKELYALSVQRDLYYANQLAAERASREKIFDDATMLNVAEAEKVGMQYVTMTFRTEFIRKMRTAAQAESERKE